MFNQKEYMKKYAIKNEKKLQAYKKKWNKEHKIYLKAKRKIWRETHKEYIRMYGEKYREKHKEKKKFLDAIYYQKHKIKLNNRQKRYNIIRRKTDIKFRLVGNLRHRVGQALKGFCKSKVTQDLIGCSIEFLKQHLEKQFKKGMSWDNYGRWHVDHIRPCASFDLSKVDEQHKCFHYMNLQPLWAKDNFVKNDN